MSRQGIDVSEHQGKINFKKVKADGIDFVILREGFRKSIDPMFLEYVKGAQSAGLPILAVYHFIYVDGASPRMNAVSTYNNIRLAGMDPDTTWIFADLEDDTYTKIGRDEPDMETATAWVKEYLDTLKGIGCQKLGIYLNWAYHEDYYDWDVLGEWKDKLFLADYTGEPDFPCLIQQTDTEGIVDGIDDTVDMDTLWDESMLPDEEDDKVHYISNSGSDENYGAHGGQAGDQTGREWCLRPWYNRPWSCILRYPDPKVGEMIADLGVKAAKNDLIGYDQYQRDTYWEQLQAVGYDPSKITVACESDCSAGVIANTRATGYLLGIPALQNVDASYTGNMRDGFRAAGFQVLTASKYLDSPDYLLPGDILLNDDHHTATNITRGSKAEESAPAPKEPAPSVGLTVSGPMDTVRYGSTGSAVKTLQASLVAIGYTLDIDGEYGADTMRKVINFQTAHGLTGDGITGPLTWNKIYDLLTQNVRALNQEPQWVGSVTASSLNVRAYASSLYDQVAAWPVLGQGNLVDVCAAVVGPEDDTWYYLRIGGSVYGFVSAKYIKKAD